MTKRRALTDIAYDILSRKRKPMPFKSLWQETIKSAELDDENASSQLGQFYSDMSLDARFVSTTDNKWDLKKRYKFEDTYVELEDMEGEDEEIEEYYDEDEESENLNREEEEDEY